MRQAFIQCGCARKLYAAANASMQCTCARMNRVRFNVILITATEMTHVCSSQERCTHLLGCMISDIFCAHAHNGGKY